MNHNERTICSMLRVSEQEFTARSGHRLSLNQSEEFGMRGRDPDIYTPEQPVACGPKKVPLSGLEDWRRRCQPNRRQFASSCIKASSRALRASAQSLRG
jgi:hypothetical protein